jgi:hypothetical protein
MEQLFVSNIRLLRVYKYLNFVSLVGRNQSNRANFIRVPSNASPSYVKQLLVRKCQNRVNLTILNHL